MDGTQPPEVVAEASLALVRSALRGPRRAPPEPAPAAVEAAAEAVEAAAETVEAPPLARSISESFRQMLDDHGDGLVELDTLRQLIKLLTAGSMSDAAIDELLKEHELSADGRVRYADFFAWVFANPSCGARLDRGLPGN